MHVVLLYLCLLYVSLALHTMQIVLQDQGLL